MKNELLDSDPASEPKKTHIGIIRLSVSVILVLLVLALIAISFSVFQSRPGLGYLMILYCAVAIAVMGAIVMLLLRGFKRMFSAITIFGSSVSILTILFIETDPDFVMMLGQLVTGVAFIVNLAMLFVIALKK